MLVGFRDGRWAGAWGDAGRLPVLFPLPHVSYDHLVPSLFTRLTPGSGKGGTGHRGLCSRALGAQVPPALLPIPAALLRASMVSPQPAVAKQPCPHRPSPSPSPSVQSRNPARASWGGSPVSSHSPMSLGGWGEQWRGVQRPVRTCLRAVGQAAPSPGYGRAHVALAFPGSTAEGPIRQAALSQWGQSWWAYPSIPQWDSCSVCPPGWYLRGVSRQLSQYVLYCSSLSLSVSHVSAVSWAGSSPR